MESKIYIYHKLGLGDHIIANGLVRQMALQYEQVFVFCKERNLDQVQRMFVDDTKIVPIVYKEDFIKNNPQLNYLVLRPKRGVGNKFDELMYEMAGVDFSHKWDSFYIERNLPIEKELMDIYGINGDEFAFLHEDKARGYVINKGKPQVRTVRPDIRYGIFDYMGILESASEIHCIDSSFLNLIECSGIKQDNLYFHKYVRIKENTEFGTPSIKRDWRVIV